MSWFAFRKYDFNAPNRLKLGWIGPKSVVTYDATTGGVEDWAGASVPNPSPPPLSPSPLSPSPSPPGPSPPPSSPPLPSPLPTPPNPPPQKRPVECGRPGQCPSETAGLRDPDELHEVR